MPLFFLPISLLLHARAQMLLEELLPELLPNFRVAARSTFRNRHYTNNRLEGPNVHKLIRQYTSFPINT